MPFRSPCSPHTSAAPARPLLLARLGALILLCIGGLQTGCRHTPGVPWEQQPLPESAPQLDAVLAGLAANDRAVETFRGPCAFTMDSPDVSGVQRLHRSSVYFRRPADLHVVGRKYGSTVVRLTCVGSEFLFAFPTEKEFYYRLAGEQRASVDFSVSPADIAREMFFPEDWADIDRERVGMTDFDPESQTVEVAVATAGRRAVKRRLTIKGPPWVVVENERLNRRGEVVAVTSAGGYRLVEGVYLPTWTESVFPLDATRMRLDFRKIIPNAEIPDAYFDIQAQAAQLGIQLDRVPGAAQQGEY